jgi:formylglycine-generating enzyme required for sulfatase activity
LGFMPHVPPGVFTMGCHEARDIGILGGCDQDEFPSHHVTLTIGFYMMQHEVTVGQWQAVMGELPEWAWGDENDPVTGVSWEDAQAFAARVSALERTTYRLPTEAEWEYAARGGEHYLFAGSGDVGAVAWYLGNPTEWDTLHEVCLKSRNAFGLCDMTGNVMEWTADWYGAYDQDPQIDPKGPSQGRYRVARGGSWSQDGRSVRIAYRAPGIPQSWNDDLGFRLMTD